MQLDKRPLDFRLSPRRQGFFQGTNKGHFPLLSMILYLLQLFQQSEKRTTPMNLSHSGFGNEGVPELLPISYTGLASPNLFQDISIFFSLIKQALMSNPINLDPLTLPFFVYNLPLSRGKKKLGKKIIFFYQGWLITWSQTCFIWTVLNPTLPLWLEMI